MPKMTIKTIAELAGVSPSAVSIVLNNRPGVSEGTRKRFRQSSGRTIMFPIPIPAACSSTAPTTSPSCWTKSIRT